MNLNIFNDIEIDVLKKHYPFTAASKMTALLPGRTISSIRNMAKKFSVQKAVGYGAKKYWTDAELQLIKQHYNTLDNAVLMQMFNCSAKSIFSAANKVSVKKSKQYLSEKFGENLRKVGVATQFKKGLVAANKGLKQVDYCSAKGLERIKAAQFKKGLIPHNVVPVGYERINVDGYTEVKVADKGNFKNNFRLKHRILYEQNIGPIEPGYVIEFIDCNKQNFDLTNLRKVTRSENILNNQNKDSYIARKLFKLKNDAHVQLLIENYSDVIDMKRKQILLNRKIKENAAKL